MLTAFGLIGAAGGVTPGSFDLISSTILSSNTSTVTLDFSSLAALGYKHLQLRIVGSTTAPSSGTSRLRMTINGQSTGYQRHGIGMSDSNTTVSSFGAPEFNGSLVISDRIPGTQNNSVISIIMDIYNAFGTKNFSAKYYHGAHVASTDAGIGLGSAFSTSTALSYMTFGNGNQSIGDEGSLATGTRFSVYGIKG